VADLYAHIQDSCIVEISDGPVWAREDKLPKSSVARLENKESSTPAVPAAGGEQAAVQIQLQAEEPSSPPATPPTSQEATV